MIWHTVAYRSHVGAATSSSTSSSMSAATTSSNVHACTNWCSCLAQHSFIHCYNNLPAVTKSTNVCFSERGPVKCHQKCTVCTQISEYLGRMMSDTFSKGWEKYLDHVNT